MGDPPPRAAESEDGLPGCVVATDHPSLGALGPRAAGGITFTESLSDTLCKENACFEVFLIVSLADKTLNCNGPKTGRNPKGYPHTSGA